MTRQRDWGWPDDAPATTGAERLAILAIVASLIAALWAAVVWAAVALVAWL
jgi:hypothetical protein